MATNPEIIAAHAAMESDGLGVRKIPNGRWVAIGPTGLSVRGSDSQSPAEAVTAAKKLRDEKSQEVATRRADVLLEFLSETGIHARPETRLGTDPQGDPIQVRTWRVYMEDGSEAIPAIVHDSLLEALTRAVVRSRRKP